MSGVPKHATVRLSAEREAELAAERRERQRRRSAAALARAAKREQAKAARQADREERIRRAGEATAERAARDQQRAAQRDARDQAKRDAAKARRAGGQRESSETRFATRERPAGRQQPGSREAPGSRQQITTRAAHVTRQDVTRDVSGARVDPGPVVSHDHPFSTAHEERVCAQAEALLQEATAERCAEQPALRALAQGVTQLRTALDSGELRTATADAKALGSRLRAAEATLDAAIARRQRRRATISAIARHLPDSLVVTSCQENAAGEMMLRASSPEGEWRVALVDGYEGGDRLRYELPGAIHNATPGQCPAEEALVEGLHRAIAADGVLAGHLVWPGRNPDTRPQALTAPNAHGERNGGQRSNG